MRQTLTGAFSMDSLSIDQFVHGNFEINANFEGMIITTCVHIKKD